MTWREGTIGIVLLALGLQLARDTLALCRWSPSLFRGGPVVLRAHRLLSRIPAHIPTPALRTGAMYSAQYRAFESHEVAFTAQTFNAPCLLGRLIVKPDEDALVLVGRLHWSLYAVFVVGFALIGFPWPVFVFMAGMFVVNYAWEVKTFQRVLQAVGDEMEASTRRAHGTSGAHNDKMQRTGAAQATERPRQSGCWADLERPR